MFKKIDSVVLRKWDYTSPHGSNYQSHWNQTLVTEINSVINIITDTTFGFGRQTNIVTSKKLRPLLETLEYYYSSSQELINLDVEFIDTTEPFSIFIYNKENYYNLQTIPKVVLNDNGIGATVTVTPITDYSEDEINKYKKLLLGCITVNGFFKYGT